MGSLVGGANADLNAINFVVKTFFAFQLLGKLIQLFLRAPLQTVKAKIN